MATSTYNQKNVGGESWVRAKRLVFENPYQGVPMLRFMEEEAFTIADGRVLREPAGSIDLEFNSPDDYAQMIELMNPETGEYLGTGISYQDLYVIMYSAYIQQVKKRNNGE